MFLDENVLKIVSRAYNADNTESYSLAIRYFENVLEIIALSGIEYLLNKDNDRFINNDSEFYKIIGDIFSEIEKDPKLSQTIGEEVKQLDRQILEFFMQTASLGDKLYLQVYIASTIKNLKEKIAKKGSSISTKNSIDFLSNSSRNLNIIKSESLNLTTK